MFTVCTNSQDGNKIPKKKNKSEIAIFPVYSSYYQLITNQNTSQLYHALRL